MMRGTVAFSGRRGVGCSRWKSLGLACLIASGLLVSSAMVSSADDPNLAPFPNPTGAARTISVSGGIDTSNPFFHDTLSTNGQACVTCHEPSEGWTISPPIIRARFDGSDGTDPLFRPNDTANSPDADVSSVEARRDAYSMMLNKGVVRLGIAVAPDAEFTVVSIDDPYGVATPDKLALFRRPLPITNVRYLSTLNWDGRSRLFDPLTQAQGVVTGLMQNPDGATPAELEQIVSFEMGLTTAQATDNAAGDLTAQGGRGGPENLLNQVFYLGINDPLGHNPTGASFDPNAFTLYQSWLGPGHTAAQQAIARGEQIFDKRSFAITGVGGLNDALGQPSIQGTCSTCHDAPNIGDHSVAAPLNIGISDASRRTPDLPLYTLQNNETGEIVQTTDPGRGIITGHWADIGKFKGPILRGLAARAPYFHNGSAATLDDAVDFYNQRFKIGLSPQEHADLVAFLKAL